MRDRLFVFDTTMRDGEQSPGASMTKDEKLRIARALERMRVDVIEAGFPASSNGDFEAVRAIANSVKDCTVAGLCRTRDDDIERAVEALRGAKSWRIHTFIATSPLHMEKKLRMTPEQVFEAAILAVRFARNQCPDVEFSPEDASRSDLDFLCRVIEAVIRKGATTINIPDTVGYAMPEQFGILVRELRERIPNSESAIWSVHCHNDLGMAVANSLAAVRMAGVRQVECTINGLGERAGNASLEEIVMAVRTRGDFIGVDTGLDTTQLVSASRLVSQITGFVVSPNKAIVGANAFAHEAGIHQSGVLRARGTYEIMDPADVGWDGQKIVLGARSGRDAVRQRLKEIGIELDSEAFEDFFKAFKDLADKKTEIFDEDLQALASGAGVQLPDEYWKLVRMEQGSSSDGPPRASLTLHEGEGEETKKWHTTCNGDGPVDAVFKAIEVIANSGAELSLYSVNAMTPGTESQGEVVVQLSKDGRIVNGVGADTDIVLASAKAYVAALNKLRARAERIDPQAEAA